MMAFIPKMPPVDVPSIALVLIPALLYICDKIYRRQESPNDIRFSLAWTLLFLIPAVSTTQALLTIVEIDTHSPIPGVSGTAFVAWTVGITYGIPLLVNSIYTLKAFLKGSASPA